jgi:hypothetical protein
MVPDKTPTSGSELVNIPPKSLKLGEPAEAALEQYRIYLDHLDKLADRRQSANSFFVTLNTGLCALLAFLFSKDTAPEIRPFSIAIPIVGILLSSFWSSLVKSYRQLSTGKFDVVHQMEGFLPFAPYRAEWAILGRGKDSSTYRPLTHIEVWVPRLFIVLYVAMLLFIAYSMRLLEALSRFAG